MALGQDMVTQFPPVWNHEIVFDASSHITWRSFYIGDAFIVKMTLRSYGMGMQRRAEWEKHISLHPLPTVPTQESSSALTSELAFGLGGVQHSPSRSGDAGAGQPWLGSHTGKTPLN